MMSRHLCIRIPAGRRGAFEIIRESMPDMLTCAHPFRIFPARECFQPDGVRMPGKPIGPARGVSARLKREGERTRRRVGGES